MGHRALFGFVLRVCCFCSCSAFFFPRRQKNEFREFHNLGNRKKFKACDAGKRWCPRGGDRECAQGLRHHRATFQQHPIQGKLQQSSCSSCNPNAVRAHQQPWPLVEKFLKEQPLGCLIADVGCGNGKYMSVNPDCFFLGSDRCAPTHKTAHLRHRPRSGVQNSFIFVPNGDLKARPVTTYDCHTGLIAL